MTLQQEHQRSMMLAMRGVIARDKRRADLQQATKAHQAERDLFLKLSTTRVYAKS